VISDTDGTRQATLLFPPGETATITRADGTTATLSSLNVRATEYTVGVRGPEAMPGALPPTSGYTYAADFSADEAQAAGAITTTTTHSGTWRASRTPWVSWARAHRRRKSR